MALHVLQRREFLRLFPRPIYGHLWLCWIALAFLLSGWRLAHDSASPQPTENFVSIGIMGLVLEFLHLAYDYSSPHRRSILLGKPKAEVSSAKIVFFVLTAIGAAWITLYLWIS